MRLVENVEKPRGLAYEGHPPPPAGRPGRSGPPFHPGPEGLGGPDERPGRIPAARRHRGAVARVAQEHRATPRHGHFRLCDRSLSGGPTSAPAPPRCHVCGCPRPPPSLPEPGCAPGHSTRAHCCPRAPGVGPPPPTQGPSPVTLPPPPRPPSPAPGHDPTPPATKPDHGPCSQAPALRPTPRLPPGPSLGPPGSRSAPGTAALGSRHPDPPRRGRRVFIIICFVGLEKQQKRCHSTRVLCIRLRSSDTKSSMSRLTGARRPVALSSLPRGCTCHMSVSRRPSHLHKGRCCSEHSPARICVCSEGSGQVPAGDALQSRHQGPGTCLCPPTA